MRVFLDLDGVITDLVGSAVKLMGFDPLIFKYPIGVYDLCTALQVDSKLFWNQLTDNEKFWSEMDWMFDGKELLKMIENHCSQHELCLLSSPTFCHYSLSGKSKWIQKNLDKYWHRRFLFGPVKEMCAGPNTLLIDDCEENCNKFVLYGGQAIMVPRLWNCGHANHHNCVETVKYLLENEYA